jgi:hypothetical protein
MVDELILTLLVLSDLLLYLGILYISLVMMLLVRVESSLLKSIEESNLLPLLQRDLAFLLLLSKLYLNHLLLVKKLLL